MGWKLGWEQNIDWKLVLEQNLGCEEMRFVNPLPDPQYEMIHV